MAAGETECTFEPKRVPEAMNPDSSIVKVPGCYLQGTGRDSPTIDRDDQTILEAKCVHQIGGGGVKVTATSITTAGDLTNLINFCPIL